jgi:hypothetical protein
VRVRLFELRLLAIALTILWGMGGGVVLLGYRPGGPFDLPVGIAASLPLLVSVAAIVWPPLVRGNRESAVVFWIGLAAGLLLIPSIAAVLAQVLQGGTEPLLPSLEVVYPWALALFATSLFAGLGISRQLINEVGIGRKRLASSICFALVASTAIGGVFGGVSLADEMALKDKPASQSRFGPTSANLTPPDCSRPLAAVRSSKLDLDIWGDVDQRAVGTVSLTGSRYGTDLTWTAQVVASDLARIDRYGAVRVNGSAWTRAPLAGWIPVDPPTLDDQLVDTTVTDRALSPTNRVTAENRGLEYVEGARARRCRVAVDGDTFAASFPQVTWLVGDVSLSTWRGELDFWIFGDGEIGMVKGSVNGSAQGILEHGLLATVRIKMTATDRDAVFAISPPSN